MPYLDGHIRALRVAIDCVALGGRVRTVAIVSGLPAFQVERLMRHCGKTPPIGRSTDCPSWLFRATLAAQAQASVFAARFTRLRKLGVAPADALIHAFRHYRQVHPEEDGFRFDRAFDLASQMEGRWNARSRSLELIRCAHCRCEFVAAMGTRASEGCPFCKLVHRSSIGPVHDRQAAQPMRDAVRHIAAQACADLDALEVARSCIGLGARLRTVTALTGLTPYELSHVYYPGLAPSAKGRAPAGEQWYRSAQRFKQADGCVFASHYARLTRAGFEPVKALITAYRHYARVCGPVPHVSFDRAFDLASRLDGRWHAKQVGLRLALCPTCHCEYLRALDPALDCACPFCGLAQKTRSRRTAAARARRR